MWFGSAVAFLGAVVWCSCYCCWVVCLFVTLGFSCFVVLGFLRSLWCLCGLLVVVWVFCGMFALTCYGVDVVIIVTTCGLLC